MADTTFSNGTVITADWLNDINDAVYTDLGGVGNLATSNGASKVGLAFSTAYATNTIGWAARLNRAVYNVFQDIPVAEWANILNGTSTTNLASYISTANTNAAAAGLPLFFPGGTFPYTPTSVLEIGNWIGASPTLSVIKVDCTSYSGVVFRVTGSTEISNLRIYEDGLSKLGTGIQLSASNTDEFTGHQRLVRVWVQGFNKNLDINNLFMVTLDQCRFESGAEGLYCAPADNAGDNGYVTTINSYNSWYFGNTRNVYFNPALTSKCVTFVGGSIEAATGSAEQAYFNKLRMLTFDGTYFEGASTIPAIRLPDASQVTISGSYFNGTGGIAMPAAEVTITSSQFVTSTDVITGGTTNSKLSLRNTSCQSTGNTAYTSFLQFSAYETDYNGVSYKAFHGNHASGFTDDGYSASITPNLRFGNTLRYTVNNTTAFTMNAPTNAVAGTTLEIIFKNTSGGAMGTITWNAVYKLPTLTLPATGFNRTYTFKYDGTNWIFQYQTSSDVPN